MSALELLRRRASEYELLAAWRAERAAGDPRYGDADALVAVAIAPTPLTNHDGRHRYDESIAKFATYLRIEEPELEPDGLS